MPAGATSNHRSGTFGAPTSAGAVDWWLFSYSIHPIVAQRRLMKGNLGAPGRSDDAIRR